MPSNFMWGTGFWDGASGTRYTQALAATLAASGAQRRASTRVLTGQLRGAPGLSHDEFFRAQLALAGLLARGTHRTVPVAALLRPVAQVGTHRTRVLTILSSLPLLSLLPAASFVPFAYNRGRFTQPQHSPRTLALVEGDLPLRATPTTGTDATDATLAPLDQNIAYYVDWSNMLPSGFGITSVSTTALMIPTVATPWSSATDVTSAFITSTTQQGPLTCVIVAKGGNQTLGAQYRVRLLATFSNTPPTTLEAYFDLTCAET